MEGSAASFSGLGVRMQKSRWSQLTQHTTSAATGFTRSLAAYCERLLLTRTKARKKRFIKVALIDKYFFLATSG